MKARLISLSIAATAVAIHVYRLIIEWRHLGRAAELEILTSSTFAVLQIFFIVCFFAWAVGLFIRKLPGRIVSVIGLGGTLLGYIYWYLYSIRLLTRYREDSFYIQHPEFMPPNALGFIGVKWWDFVILGATVIILAWQIGLLVKTLRATRTEFDPAG